jgi:hypothetical protein
VVAALVAFFGQLTSEPREPGPSTQAAEVSRTEVARVRRDLRTLQRRLQALRQPSGRARLTGELRALESRLVDVE